MYYYISVDENGKITDVLYMTNGINDIEYLGWDREEKESKGAFVETLPEDYSDNKYLYIDGEFVLNPDYVPIENENVDYDEIALDHEFRISILELGI
ncbi:MAG: hypothetical protein J6J52_03175 [Oscillospiraceae bacterium]|nr:hypothetical protein [Oscillospiraceae bacterium]